jgi:hypothetical protein
LSAFDLRFIDLALARAMPGVARRRLHHGARASSAAWKGPLRSVATCSSIHSVTAARTLRRIVKTQRPARRAALRARSARGARTVRRIESIPCSLPFFDLFWMRAGYTARNAAGWLCFERRVRRFAFDPSCENLS